MATCWVARAGRYFYTSNAGSGSVSGYAANGAGQSKTSFPKRLTELSRTFWVFRGLD